MIRTPFQYFALFLLLFSCQNSQKESGNTLEIRLDFVEDNPENLDKASQGFIDYAENTALAIEKKLKKSSFQYTLAIAAIFQNEADYIKEWIEFHKLVGVQHFFLFNNLSSDNYLEVLKPYILSGDVDLIEWPYQTNENGSNWPTIQRAAYLTAVKLTSGKVKWLALIDTDEFIVPVESDNLISALHEYEGYGGVAINWQMYGTSHIEKIPTNDLLVEALLQKAPTDYPENFHVKTIVCPEHVLMCHVHHSVFKTGFFEVDTDKEPVSSSRTSRVLSDKIRINHYWSKDEGFFYQTKIARRKKWQEEKQNMLKRVNNCNQETDAIMLRFVPNLRKKMGLQEKSLSKN